MLGLLIAGCADAHDDQQSYRLPEVRISPPTGAVTITKPAWSRVVARPGDIAVGSNIVAFDWSGRFCAFGARDGTQKWCARRGASPALANGEIAFTSSDGAVVALDSRTGAERWRHIFPTSRTAAALPGPTFPPHEVAWSGGTGFVVARDDGRADRGAPNYGVITENGHLLWQTELVGGFQTPVIVGRYVLQPVEQSGAIAHTNFEAFPIGVRLAKPTSIEAEAFVGAKLPSVFLSGHWLAGPVDDFFLSFEVRSADLERHTLGPVFSYTPDYGQNYKRYQANEFAGQGEARALEVRDGWVYGLVGKAIYRYRYANGHGQRPLLVSEGFIGGPAEGEFYVLRPDGIWALRPTSDSVQARHVAEVLSTVNMLQVIGKAVYIAFVDGRLIGTDAKSGRSVLTASICPAQRLFANDAMIFAVCSSDARSNIVAFRRPPGT